MLSTQSRASCNLKTEPQSRRQANQNFASKRGHKIGNSNLQGLLAYDFLQIVQ